MIKPVRDYLARCTEDPEFAEAYQELEPEYQAERARIHRKEETMSKSVEIEKVVLKVGEKEIPLTVEEAKELQDILNRTFGEEKTVYVPSSPIVIERPYYPYYPYYPHWYVTWDVNTNALHCSSQWSST